MAPGEGLLFESPKALPDASVVGTMRFIEPKVDQYLFWCPYRSRFGGHRFHVKKVQHPTGGVVGQLYVHDGDHVTAGQLLIRLDETASRAVSKSCARL
jgi:biotin carboxyl carrier protein